MGTISIMFENQRKSLILLLHDWIASEANLFLFLSIFEYVFLNVVSKQKLINNPLDDVIVLTHFF